MKILIYSVLFPNSVQNTYGMFVSERVRFLKNHCEIKVVAPVPFFPNISIFKKWTKYSLIPKFEVIDGVEVYHPRFLLFPKNIFRKYLGFLLYLTTRTLIKTIKKDYNFDLIHAHFAVPSGIAASHLSKYVNVPFIITEHFSKLHEDLSINSNIKKKLIKVYNKNSLIIAVSEKIKSDLVNVGIKKERIRIIPNGVDCNKFPISFPSKKMNPIRLLSIGGLIESKGFIYLIKAVKMLNENNINVVLTIIGEGKQRSDLENLIKKLKLDEKVILKGNILHSQLKDYFNKTHIFVLPSLFESFSVVTIEALSCGIPVIVTKCGGPEYFVTDEVGLIIKKENENILADNIEKMINSYKYYNKNKIRQYCKNNFDYKIISPKIISTYEQILSNSSLKLEVN